MVPVPLKRVPLILDRNSPPRIPRPLGTEFAVANSSTRTEFYICEFLGWYSGVPPSRRASTVRSVYSGLLSLGLLVSGSVGAQTVDTVILGESDSYEDGEFLETFFVAGVEGSGISTAAVVTPGGLIVPPET